MKKLLYLILALTVLCVAGFLLVNEKLPDGEPGLEAEALADKMLSAVNIQGWDSITAIKWTYRDSHHYIWDKTRNLVQVEWKANKVLLNTYTKKGVVWSDNSLIEESKRKDELIQKAWSYFVNDSFWFSAPFKIRDAGTKRKLVRSKGGDALLVTYTTGGVTPGDSYLWLLDKDGLPRSWKMWVNIIPIGGIRFSWEDWNVYNFNTKISTTHQGLIDIVVSDFKTSEKIELLANGKDPFEGFE